MSTVEGDVSKQQDVLGRREDGNYMDMNAYADSINKINKERTARYFDLVKRPESDKKSRDGVVRRIKP